MLRQIFEKFVNVLHPSYLLCIQHNTKHFNFWHLIKINKLNMNIQVKNIAQWVRLAIGNFSKNVYFSVPFAPCFRFLLSLPILLKPPNQFGILFSLRCLMKNSDRKNVLLSWKKLDWHIRIGLDILCST